MGGGGGDVESHTYYYYRIKFAHGSIDPASPIFLYDAFGTLVQTVPAYYQYMDYGSGILSVPGSEQNTTVESVSSATYDVFYSADSLVIDYNNALFKISKTIVRNPAQSTIRATFEFLTSFTPIKDIASVIDGKWDTQIQTEFYSEPVKGYEYAILDMGAEYNIQALDVIGGFFKPDGDRKFDINCNLTLQYSLNGVDFYDISDKTNAFTLEGGKTVSFEEKDLGIGFNARYFKLLIDSIKKNEYRGGMWVIAITEVSAYSNIVIKSEGKLIPTTVLTEAITPASTTLNVDSTIGFTEPESAEEVTAYILNTDGTTDIFTYSGLTPTSFTGVNNITLEHGINTYVVKAEETDITLYDQFNLLPKLGDRFYKKSKVDDNVLFTTAQLNYLSKAYLKEFCKNHSKINIDVLYSPHIQVGQTIRVEDTYNNIDENYFVEAIKNNNGAYSLTLARYPA